MSQGGNLMVTSRKLDRRKKIYSDGSKAKFNGFIKREANVNDYC